MFLVSTTEISLDYDDAPLGLGRGKHHFAAIKAAAEAGFERIYYTSLAFGPRSKASVMRAHLRTESFLAAAATQKQGGMGVTVIRQGLYNESWPLYFGYFDPRGHDERTEVLVAGDRPISWTALKD